MTKYNCIIKEFSGDGGGGTKILGRIFLQDLSQVPDEWEIKLRGTSISRDTNLEKLMCTSRNPVVIYKKSASATKTSSYERHTTTSSYERDATTRSLHLVDNIIKRLRSISLPLPFFRNENVRSVGAIGAGGFGFDFDTGPINGVGVKTSIVWKSYKHGMNLVGLCTNKNCCSNKSSENGSQVFYCNGYGEIYLPDDLSKFSCPACDSSTFQIANFVLSCGRALFKYKKSGIDSEVKEFIVESNGPLEEHKTFDIHDMAEQPVIDYDFVLIMTVAKDQSFYYCIDCDKIIDEEKDEEMLSCGHSYHKSTCFPGPMGCTICNSEYLESVSSLLLTVASS